jgi:hypothetical protein
MHSLNLGNTTYCIIRYYYSASYIVQTAVKESISGGSELPVKRLSAGTL